MKLVFQAFLQPFLQPSRGEKADASVSSLPERLAISLLSETFQARRKEKKMLVPVRGNRWRPDSVILLLVDGFILPPNDGQRGLGIGRGRSGSLKERVRRKSRGVVDRSNGATKCCIERIFSTLRRVQESYDRGKRLKFVEIFWFVDKIFYRNEM